MMAACVTRMIWTGLVLQRRIVPVNPVNGFIETLARIRIARGHAGYAA